MKPLLLLIYGPNGAGKTTVARALATKYRGFHIQIDIFQVCLGVGVGTRVKATKIK